MKIMFISKVTLIFSIALLANCANYSQLKNNQKPNLKISTPVPQIWSNSINHDVVIAENGWINEFNDPQITLIAKAIIANNQDLKVAASNVIAAEAAAKKVGANLKPKIDLELSNNTTGEVSQSNTNQTSGISTNISWEADIWGKLSAKKAESANQFEASKEDYIAARESLIALGVKSYLFAIQTLQQQQIALKNRDSYVKDLKIAEEFYAAGSKTEQDVALSKASLADAEETLITARNNHEASLRSLELLLGQYPAGEYAVPNILPEEPKAIPSGVPSYILEQRPDIRAAERRVAAAFNATTISKAAQLPSIALTSSVGASSNDLNKLADPTNLFWNLTGNLLAPLFNDGRLQNDVEIASANQEAAIASYQQAALNAFNDVETALSNEQAIRKRISSLQVNSNQSKFAYKFEKSKYLQGIGSITNITQLEHKMIVSQIDLVSAKQALISERVNLYLALGIPAFVEKSVIDICDSLKTSQE